MIRVVLSILVVLSTSSALWLTESKPRHKTEWAVLIAGSAGWYNYRHQADVCHAYHILRSNGISEDHIITFMYDDIASHPENPYPGQIFNDYRHIDYYRGVQIDYREEEVNVDNFIGALLGSPELKAKGKKVLESGPEDDVFIYFTDHGNTHLIGFPDGYLVRVDLNMFVYGTWSPQSCIIHSVKQMTAKQLNDTLTKMHEKEMFSKLVFYLEACESGSMFEDILCPHINACLADEYSHNWLEDTETHDTRKRTLQKQFTTVRRMTKNSHVQKFGDSRMARLHLSDFQGITADFATLQSNEVMENMDLIPSRYAQIHMLQKRLQNNQKPEDNRLIQKRLERLLQLNKMAIETFEDIEELVRRDSPSLGVQSIHNWFACYESALVKYTNLCFKIHKVPAVAEILPRMVQLCKQGYETQAIENAITLTCE